MRHGFPVFDHSCTMAIWSVICTKDDGTLRCDGVSKVRTPKVKGKKARTNKKKNLNQSGKGHPVARRIKPQTETIEIYPGVPSYRRMRCVG
jgi:hypothetical protein